MPVHSVTGPAWTQICKISDLQATSKSEMSVSQITQISDYTFSLPLEAKERYKQKLVGLKCSVDPYIDTFESQGPLPPVTYADIYEFLVSSHTLHSCERKNAFKSLDAYRMVCSEGWMSTLGVKEWPNAVVLKCDVKPSQKSGKLYKTWVAVKRDGSVVTGHCTCMAGLSEVCNHVGAILYKCMQETPLQSSSEMSCTSLPCQWLPAKKNVAPAELTEIDFRLPKLDKCKSTVLQPKPKNTSAKSSSYMNHELSEPSEAEKDKFFQQLSMLEHKVSVLSVHHKFNKPYLPVSQAKSLPATIISLHDQSKEKASYSELLQCAISLKATYKVSDEEITALEEST